jgi:predicted metal-dependent phosphoesterase TrpH
MRADPHTHSDRSDGTDAPAELVRLAASQGLDVVALTDHDTTDGWAEAGAAAEQFGVRLVRGLEVSCRFADRGVHLLAYEPDPDHPPLAAELARIREGRAARVPAMLERLRALGVDIDESDLRRAAGHTTALGRPHVADALISLGVVSDRTEAFEKYLNRRGPGYVRRYAADLEQVIAWVTEAGGVSVLAHPWTPRHDYRALDEAGLSLLKDAGLAGVEVDHEDHDPATREELRAVAERLDLVVTGSSDYHGTGKVGHDLGCNTTSPEQLDRLDRLIGSRT